MTMKVCCVLFASLLLALADPATARRLPPGARRLQDGSPVQVNFYDGKNINGDLLILDVNSLQYKGNHPYFYGMSGPDTGNKDNCAQRCARTTGCNAFVTCDKPEGCGSGCKAYVASNPKLQASFDSANYENLQPPVLAFGAWTYPLYDMDGCANTTADYDKVTNDKWGWGLCSLKHVADEWNPPMWDSTDGSSQEFASGVLIKPANCPDGLPYSVCAQCNALGEDKVWQCLDCASNFKENNPVKEASTIGDRNYDMCPRCFADGKNPGDCIQCLKDKVSSGEAYMCVQ